MGDDERQSLVAKVATLEAKLDMILSIVKGDADRHRDCRAHCDAVTQDVYGRFKDLAGQLNQLVGSKTNPYWWYVGAMILFGVINIFLMFHFNKCAPGH
jgi:hypothetical protein